MNEELVTGYVTKYALTKGVLMMKGVVSESGALHKPRGWLYIGRGDWFTNKEDALRKAEKMRVAKIASLKKQISRLQGLEIKVIEAPEGVA